MAIRTREQVVPSHFPPARLFLDDLDEIVDILKALVSTAPTTDSAVTSVTFSCGHQYSNEITDVPRMLRNNPELEIRIAKGSTGTTLGIRPWSSAWWWSSADYTKENRWSAFHNLETIFKRRNRRWATLCQSMPWWSW